MWIRSKDKFSLINASGIEVSKINQNELYAINGSSRWFMGSYKTRERALEVLNEIQNHLCYGTELRSLNEYGRTNISYYIYEMPKE